ncbi:MAG: LPS export ABC transporter periplasmic protein LptC [Sulfurovum sp.]|nr:LPS export ABC transporter periplasmic protein LptC [Sulfurovum sp.]NNJ44741.1 LPS export ABC transporter periplasmic protein LptC [Sulfurovum sp.]
MGVKLEVILTSAIIGIISGALLLKLGNTPVPTQVFTKEIEFTNTTLIEVDTDKMKSRAYTTYGVRDKDVLTLDKIVYTGDRIESLSANKARFKDDFIHLDGDVVMQEKDGYKYETQHAIYNKETEILNITSPFTGVRGQNRIKGESMEYNTRKKKATGTSVGTVFYTPDK